MSTDQNQPSSSTGRKLWESLSHTRQQLLVAIAHLEGSDVFTRPELEDDIEASTTLSNVIDDSEAVITSARTPMLNNLVDDGYLKKTYQGGGAPIALDLAYEEDRDEVEVAPFGNGSKFRKLVSQVLEREGLSESDLDDVDMGDINAVITAVNRAVGRTVVVIVSEPSKYCFIEDSLVAVETQID